ncbi:hypothetical protein GCM10020000_29020 [Streptomyces olivoverticillatus]
MAQWVWTAAAVVVTTALNLAGVRTAALAGFWVLVLELAVLAVFVVAAVVALAHDGARRGWLTPLAGEGGFSAAAVLGGVSVAVLSFLGFDAIAAFAEESAGGSERVARAVVTCLVAAGVLFVVQTYLVALLAPMSAAELAAAPGRQGAAFYDTVDAASGLWLHHVVAASKAVGAAFAALAGQAAAGRLLFAMARDRRLPGLLAKVDRGSGAPRAALLGAAAVTLVAAVWAARRDDGLDRLVSVVDVGALTAFALLHLSVIGWFRRQRGALRPVVHVMVPLAGLAVVAAVIATAAGAAQAVGALWLAAGLGVLGGHRRCGGRQAERGRACACSYRPGLSVAAARLGAWLSTPRRMRRCP